MASIVVIAEVPMLSTGVMQERMATPSRWTVQAPQSAMPQPNFVPVMPSTSRKTHNKGISPSTSTVRSTLLTLSVMAIATSGLLAWQTWSHHSLANWGLGMLYRWAGAALESLADIARRAASNASHSALSGR